MIKRKKNETNQLQNLTRSLKSLGGIEFVIEIYPDGKWVAESKNVDGIITGGSSISKIEEVLKDAIFTYFEILPPEMRPGLLRRDTVVYTERIGLALENQPA